MTDVCNPYPDETVSLKAMPPTCPLLLLPYGLLSEKITPLVQQERRSIREDRRRALIEEISMGRLNDLLAELYKRATMDPYNSIWGNYSWKDRESKATIDRFMCRADVPPFFLEETLQEQHREIVPSEHDIVLGDWVKCYGRAPLGKSFGTYIGVGVVVRTRVRRSPVQTTTPQKVVQVGLLHKSPRIWSRGARTIAFRQQLQLGEACCKVVDLGDADDDIRCQLTALAKQFEGALCRRCLYPTHVCDCELIFN